MKYFVMCLSGLFLASCFRLSKNDEGKPGFRSISPSGMGSGLSTLVYPTPLWTPSLAPTATPYWTRTPTPISTPQAAIRNQAGTLDSGLEQDLSQDSEGRNPEEREYQENWKNLKGPRKLPDTRSRHSLPQAGPGNEMESGAPRRLISHLELQGFAYTSDLTVFEQNGIADFVGGAGFAALIGGYYGDNQKSMLGALLYWASLDPTVNSVTLSSGPLKMNPLMLRLAVRGPALGSQKWEANAALGLGVNWASHCLDGAVQDKCRSAGYECSESLENGWGMSFGFGLSRRFFESFSLGLQLDYFSFIHQANFGARDLATGAFRGQSLQLNFGWLSLSPRIALDF